MMKISERIIFCFILVFSLSLTSSTQEPRFELIQPDVFAERGSMTNAWADYDNDGDLDLLVVNLNKVPKLLRNDGGNRNHWLTIDAKLPGGKTDAIGARITVTVGSLKQIQDIIPVTGYLSQSDPRRHFGLGKAEKAAKVEIRWPNGQIAKLKDVKADQFLTVIQETKTGAKKQK